MVRGWTNIISRSFGVLAMAAAVGTVYSQTSVALTPITSTPVQNQQGSSVITEVVIKGNRRVNNEAILARMQTKIGQPYVQAQLDSDRDALLRMGFFKAVDVVPTPLEGNNFRITVTVSEFDAVKEIRIVGNTALSTEEIMKVVTIPIDQPFNTDEQTSTGNAITKLYSDKGYFVLIEQLEPLADSPSTVSIVIRESKVKTVVLQGNTRTKDRVLRSIVKTRPGDTYNEFKFIRELQQLLSTQWFEKVDYDRRAEEYDFNLTVALKEGRTALLTLGAAVDPRSSIAGQLSFFETNFRGSGQTIGINLSQAINIGGPSVDLVWRNPFLDSKDTALDVNLFSKSVYRFSDNGFGSSSSPTNEQFTERRTGASIGLSRPVGDRQRASIGLRFEGIRTSNIDNVAQGSFIQQDGTLGVLSLGYLRNRRDYDLDPSRGDWLNILVEPGFGKITKIGGALQDPSILGSNNFVRSTVEYRNYFTSQPPRDKELDAARRVVAFRALAGTIGGKVPFFEQFFAGGSQTVRGYQDDRFWGKQTILTSLEYRHPLQKGFNGVLFVDYGGAWGGYGTVNEYGQSSKLKMNLGYGLGFGFKTPLGPIRLDFGFNERGRSRTHFQIGTSF